MTHSALKTGGPINKTSAKSGGVKYRDLLDRVACREKANSLCQRCNGVGTQLHHVLTKAAHPELRHFEGNHLWVCDACHGFFHQSPLEGWRWARDNGFDCPKLDLAGLIERKG